MDCDLPRNSVLMKIEGKWTLTTYLCDLIPAQAHLFAWSLCLCKDVFSFPRGGTYCQDSEQETSALGTLGPEITEWSWSTLGV